MPLDHYLTLGRSGLRVSPLCLGAMTFGEDLGWGSSVEESQQIIDRYVDLGEEEELLHLDPQRNDVWCDVRDDRRQQSVIEGPNLHRVDFCHEPLRRIDL